MRKSLRTMAQILFVIIMLPFQVAGIVAAFVWMALQCGFWIDCKVIEWVFDKQGALTWKIELPLSKGERDHD